MPALNRKCDCFSKQDIDHRLGKWHLVVNDYAELFIYA